MNTELLIAHGNTHRERHQPEQALSCYAQAFVQDRTSAGAFNNYGNVLREMGFPEQAQPFLEYAVRIDPTNETARFNLAVCYLLMGNYKKGWIAYEDRWNFEHLKGTLPNFSQPRWQGEDLSNRTILVVGEQGLGDTIQFVRFVENLCNKGARVLLAVQPEMVTLFKNSDQVSVLPFGSTVSDFDFWTPIMSLPGILDLSQDQLHNRLSYINPDPNLTTNWQKRLGAKHRLRIGFSWAGRRDTWIHQHKSVPFEQILQLVKSNPNYEWVNLQVDADSKESHALQQLGCKTYPGTISCLADSAALLACMDVVISVDTAVSHLAAALGKPTWIMLNQYGVDWRWLLNRADSPWYPTARLFRQPTMGNWGPVLTQISKHLSLFKI